MSVPNDLKVATVTDLDIPAAGQVASVETGPVDIFAVNDQGVRMPLLTLATGAVAFGASAPGRIVAVPRQDAVVHLVDEDPATVDAQLAGFASALAAQMGAVATSLAGVARGDFAGAFSQVVQAAWATTAQQRAQEAASALESSEAAWAASNERIAFSAATLHDTSGGGSSNPLVRVLTLLGAQDGFAIVEPPVEAIRTSKDPLRLIAHASNVRYRPVTLSQGWQQGSTGSFLAVLTGDGPRPTPVALTRGRKGYRIQGPQDSQPRPLTSELSARIAPSAFEFYTPLDPNRPATVRDVLTIGLRNMRGSWLLACAMALGVALLGMLTPALTNIMIGTVIPSGEQSLLVQIGCALAAAAAVAFVFSLVQNFTVSAISQRATRTMQASMWDRVLSLPADFFRGFSSGDLTVRVMAVDSLTSLLSSQVVSAILAAVFGLANLYLMFTYSVTLGFVGLFVLLATVIVLVLGVRSISRNATDSLTATKQANGWLVQMLQGIMKIRLANAETRMESRYLDFARHQAVAMARETLTVGRINAWFTFVMSGATAMFYLVILLSWDGAAAPISTASYMAFASAFGLTFAAISGLSALMSPLANAGPTFNMLRPIMEALPETSGDRQDPGRLTGRIELRDVYFRYTPDGPMILKGLNLKVEPGTMVALVGPSGAGKSTITRQLLGFDKPERGQVLYDGRDLQNLDPTLVRSQMGVVVQEGKITRGSIMKNILGGTSQDEALAWRAAAKAALADDIKAMPMGMQTIVDPGNLSGGQAQRILLARALVHEPAVLILDEATSALDNASQAVVTQAMQDLKATRIVIAHRLSTIRSADRIIVLEAGVAVEEGTYDELLAKDGEFAALVKRQVA